MERKKGKKKNNVEEIKEKIDFLPFFSIEDLRIFNNTESYLRIIISRLLKLGKIISLKRGFYISEKYLLRIKQSGRLNEYLEFLANVLYAPSYLSLEYVLNEYGLLTDSSFAFTLVSVKKTNKFINEFGVFNYFHIKEELFNSFKLIKKDDLLIYKAELSKALFDFLYLRKNILINKETVSELRINLENLKRKDLNKLKKYIKLEGSKKMKDIFDALLFLWKKQR